MSDYILNETPLRTTNNFGINNIKIENIEIPKKNSNFKVDIKKDKAIIDEDLKNELLTYGVGKLLEENVLENANSKLRIVIGDKNENIKITYNFDDSNLNLINNIEIIANENTNSNVIIQYKSNTNKKCFHNSIINLIAKENSKINISVINLLNGISDNFESFENKLYDNSEVLYTIIDIGGKNSISNYYSNIIGKSAKNDLKTIYLGIENQLKDINYIVDVRGEKSIINMDVQGALKDNSKKHFKGTIDFKKGAKKSKGNENEYCMLLSDTAKSIALPMLLCTEDDVEGNHSTATGKIDKEILFYIMSRGMSYKESIKLVVRAKFNSILENIKDEEIRQEIIEEIEMRLD